MSAQTLVILLTICLSNFVTSQLDPKFQQYCNQCVHNDCACRGDHIALRIECKSSLHPDTDVHSIEFPQLFNESLECRNFTGLDGAAVKINIDYPISEIPANCLTFNAETLFNFSLTLSFQSKLRQIHAGAFQGISGITELVIDHGADATATFPLSAFLEPKYKCAPSVNRAQVAVTYSALQFIAPGDLHKLWKHTNCSSISFNASFNQLSRLNPGDFANVTFDELILNQNSIEAIHPKTFSGSQILNKLYITLKTKTAYDKEAFAELKMTGDLRALIVSLNVTHNSTTHGWDWYENPAEFQCYAKDTAINLCPKGMKQLIFFQGQAHIPGNAYAFCKDLLTALNCEKLSQIYIDASLVYNVKNGDIFYPGTISMQTLTEHVTILTP